MTESNLDPDVANWLIRVMPDRDPATVEQARIETRQHNAEALAAMDPKLVPAGDEVGEIPADGDLPALPTRVLRPATTLGGSEIDSSPMMTIVFLHGGGWVVGDLETHLGHARRLCAQVHAVVVMIGYRLAPEHRFPVAFDDAVRGTEWVAAHLSELGGNDVLVVAGDSVGGQLAASVAIARRDAGQPLDAQLLLYPVTDVAGRYVDADVNAGYMSRGATHRRFGLTLEGMVNFSNTYVDEADSADWRVSPKRASDLTGVAPAVIHTSTLDVLRTEGNFFGDDLRTAGVDVIAREHPSLNHSYFGLGGVSTVADAAASQAAEDLHEILARRR